MKLLILALTLTILGQGTQNILYRLAKRTTAKIGTRDVSSRNCILGDIDGRPGLTSNSLRCAARVGFLSYYNDPIQKFPSKYGFDRSDPVYDIDGNILSKNWDSLGFTRIFFRGSNLWTGSFDGEGYGNCQNWTLAQRQCLHGITNFGSKIDCDRKRYVGCLCVNGTILTPAPIPATSSPTLPTTAPTALPTIRPTTPRPTTKPTNFPTGRPTTSPTQKPTTSPNSCGCANGERCVDTGMNKTCVHTGQLSFTLTWDKMGSSWGLDLYVNPVGLGVCGYANPSPNSYNGFCNWEINDETESGEPNMAYPRGPEHIFYSVATPTTYHVCVDRDDPLLRQETVKFQLQVNREGSAQVILRDQLEGGVEYNDDLCIVAGGGKVVYSYTPEF